MEADSCHAPSPRAEQSAVAREWGRLTAADRSLPIIYALLAATAAAHKLTLATRNTADFENTGVAVVNPFA